MEKVYRRKNGTIFVTLPESCDREKLKEITEVFLKNVIREEHKNGNSNTRANIRKEQVLHR